MTFPPPDFSYSFKVCPKCQLDILDSEVSVKCPKCFTLHHKRCIHEGVHCGNPECDYVFLYSDEDGTLVFPEYLGEERRKATSDRRKVNLGPPPGMPERRIGPRRRSDF